MQADTCRYKFPYKLIPAFWVCFARPSQSTHNSSIWLGVMQQKVAILNKEKSADFPVKLL